MDRTLKQKFRAMIVRFERRRAVLQREIELTLAAEGAWSALSDDGRMTIVTQSLRDPSAYQVTSLTRDGEAWGHFDTTIDRLAQEVSSAIGKRKLERTKP